MKNLEFKLTLICIVLLNLSVGVNAQSSEPDFYEMLDAHGSIMLLIDSKTGSIEYANYSAANFYGYTIEQLESMKISEINTLKPEETKREMQDAVKENRNYFIFKHRISSGEVRTVEVYSYPYLFGDKEMLFSIIHDITDKNLLEEKHTTMTNIFLLSLAVVSIILLTFSTVLFINLKKLRAKTNEINNLNELRKTFSDADNRISYLKDNNLKYIFVNKALEKFYNMDEVEIIGYDDFHLTGNEFAKIRRKTDLDALEKNTIIEDEVKWGNRIYKSIKFPVNFLSGKRGVGAYIEDVTEVNISRRKEEKNLLRNSILVNVFSHNFNSSQDQLDYVLSQALQLTESKFGYIYLYDEVSQEFILNTWSKEVMPECEIVDRQTKYQLKNTGLWGEIVRQRKPIVVNNFKMPNDMKKGYPEGHVKLSKFMSIPVIIDDKIVAVVGLADKKDDYDDNDVYQLTVLMSGVWNAKERWERTTQLEKANIDIRYLGYHDSLTGLYNRMFFEEELRRLDTKRNLPISIIMGDVNGLKLTNDIFGHVAGDILLKKVAEVFKDICRLDDIIARIGGDEFIILLPQTKIEEAENIILRIKNQLSKERIDAIKCSISMGCHTKVYEEQDIVKTMQKAEDKMYSEKTLNRKNVNSTLIKTIIETLHGKSNYEEKHSKIISEICENIGLAMNLSDVEIRRVKEAGFLHDIGKIVLVDNVLKNNDTLSDEENKKIKEHPIVGYRILNYFDETLDLAECVLAHHERWDGSGYPKGLKGEEIPKLARIIAVAEGYYEITNRVNNKKILSDEEAIVEIQKYAGSRFDPSIVEIFIKKILGGNL